MKRLLIACLFAMLHGSSFAGEGGTLTVIVSPDGRALMVKKAADKAPVAVPIIERCGVPVVGEPRIRAIRTDKGKVLVTFGKHCGATVFLRDLRVTCDGCD